MATYFLQLPIGKITRNPDGTFRGQIFDSQESEKFWAPQSPEFNGGWKRGDKLIVTCGFHTQEIIDPSTGAPYPLSEQPTPSDFFGLSADALYDPTREQVQAAEDQLKRQSAGVVGTGITTSSTPDNATDIFYNAQSSTEDVMLHPPSRGTIQNIVYMWEMDFNADFNNGGAGSVDTLKIDVLFGYGDPMLSESMT